jgi:hypothetical protein
MKVSWQQYNNVSNSIFSVPVMLYLKEFST